MWVKHLLDKIYNKLENGDKIVVVKGIKHTGFDLNNNALILKINDEHTYYHNCDELLEFVEEENISIFNNVLISDNGRIRPAKTFYIWKDEFRIY